MRKLTVTAALLSMLALSLAVPAGVLAAAPPNDSFKTPTAITALPYTTQFDLSEATDDSGTPPCEAAAHRRIWYSYTPPTDQAVRVSVGGIQAAELAVWNVTKPTSKAPQLARCAVDGHDLVVKLTAGKKYDFSIGVWTNDPPFAGTLTIAIQPPPPNDDFADAILIASNPFQDTIEDGVFKAATTESGEPTPSCTESTGTSGSAWYRFSPPTDSTVSITTFNSLGFLSVYEGTTLTSLTEQLCLLGPGGGQSFSAQAGHTYYLQVWGWPDRDTNLTVEFNVPPANDAFADREDLGSEPTGGNTDLTLATTEPGEPLPSCASSGSNTAWWSFTAPADGTLQLSDDTPGLFLGAYTGSSLASLAEIGCTTWYNTMSLPLSAGDTIAIQAGAVFLQPTLVSFGATFVPSPQNDDIADAIHLDIPGSAQVDLSAATLEPGEGAPTCAGYSGRSAWFTFTAPSESVSISLDQGSYPFAVAASTGSPGSLNEIGCRSFDGQPLTVHATPGATVYVDLFAYDWAGSFATTISVDLAGQPQAGFGYSPSDPSVQDSIGFFDLSSDPAGSGIASRSWDFGDGATSTDAVAFHQYAADGDYQVGYSITTTDGRSASTTQLVSVRTHDVGIVRFQVPSTAKSGQSKTITVGVGNRHYPENVTVQLFVSRPNGEELVGTKTLDVAVLAGGQSADVPFSYTFGASDATAGKATFHAVVTLNSARDAVPTDNQAISVATKVTR